MIHSSLGTVVQETSNFLVEEKIIASPTTSVTFSDLDGIKDAGYVLEIAGIINSAAASRWFCYVNGDTTLANYHSTWVGQSSNTGGTAAYSIVAEPYQAFGVGVGTRVFSKADILFCPGSGLTTFFSMTRSFHPTSTTNGGWSGYHEHRVAQVNITSLTITSDVANAIGAGTVIRLYRKKQGVPSAFPSAQGMLVADILVPTNVTQIDITGLDANLHGGYTILANVSNATSSSSLISCYVNDDVTAANYYTQQINADSTSLTATRYNTNRCMAMEASLGAAVFGMIEVSLGGGDRCRISSTTSRGNGSGITIDQEFCTKVATVSNITKLSFVAAVASSIAAGSRISVYRRK